MLEQLLPCRPCCRTLGTRAAEAAAQLGHGSPEMRRSTRAGHLLIESVILSFPPRRRVQVAKATASSLDSVVLLLRLGHEGQAAGSTELKPGEARHCVAQTMCSGSFSCFSYKNYAVVCQTTDWGIFILFPRP